MKDALLLFIVLPIFIMIGSVFISSPMISLAIAQSDSVIQSQETNYPGIIAELIQCKRKKGVLTVKVRLKNISVKSVKTWWPDVHKTSYLLDETNQKKYFPLKDAKGECICNAVSDNIKPNMSRTSWFKFPAPPQEVEEISIVFPLSAPFEDVPIKDK
ncbi:MAG: hypothetical protein JRE65_10680 [Deltaproteobacteria bacterium]|jgi:hypothetical protein|nr:hypothetical protein [Deltaproteobacteria bacterium]